EACVAFDRFVFLKLRSPLRPAVGSSSEPSLARKLFIDAHAFSIVPSTEKCSALKRRFTRGWASRAERNPCAISLVSSRSRFFEKVEASKIGSSIANPTNQRNNRSNSSRSTNWRSERIEYKNCNRLARNRRSGAIEGRPPAS